MVIFRIVVIGFALAVDSLLISITLGVCQKKYRIQNSIGAGSNFGFFQVFFFIAGSFFNIWAQSYIVNMERWISFGILLFIGIKMIVDARKESINPCLKDRKVSIITYFLLGIATSIDAFAVGFTFHTHQIPFLPTFLSVFSFSFLFGFIGIWIGCFLGTKNIPILPYISGVLLCLLGVFALVF
ncbi:MAG: manganese efflux pump [Caldisericia bacterium]|nr:manganese efflux pump [Caldisericia bacterium]